MPGRSSFYAFATMYLPVARPASGLHPCYPAFISSRRPFTIGTVVAVAVFIVIRTQKPHRAVQQADDAIPIRERIKDGLRELSTEWMKL